jgi:hypothetical protein
MRSGDLPSSSCSRKSGSTSKKRQNSDINLDWDETFEDAFITDVEVADLKNRIQIESPFAFGKWWSTLVEPRKSTPSTENLEIVKYEVDLHHSKQLSSFAKTDCCSTNFNSGSVTANFEYWYIRNYGTSSPVNSKLPVHSRM